MEQMSAQPSLAKNPDHSIQIILSCLDEISRDPQQVKRAEFQALKSAYEQGSLTISDLKTALTNLAGQDEVQSLLGAKPQTSLASTEAIARLAADLSYVATFQNAGLAGLNHRLDMLLYDLKNGSVEKLPANLSAMNDVLNRMIYLFPHEITGISLRLAESPESADAKSEDEDLDDLLAPNSFYPPNIEALKALGELKGDIITLPLPYGFTTGTHGSGQRGAASISRENVRFSTADSRRGQLVGVDLLVEMPMVYPKLEQLPIDRVLSLEFVKTETFTPLVGVKIDGPNAGIEKALVYRGNALENYLAFRGFSLLTHWNDRERLSTELNAALSDSDWEFCRALKGVRLDSKLTDIGFPEDPNATFQETRALFLIVKEQGAYELLELAGQHIPLSNFSYKPAHAALLATGRLRGERGTLKTYNGEDIIKRLSLLWPARHI